MDLMALMVEMLMVLCAVCKLSNTLQQNYFHEIEICPKTLKKKNLKIVKNFPQFPQNQINSISNRMLRIKVSKMLMKPNGARRRQERTENESEHKKVDLLPVEGIFMN